MMTDEIVAPSITCGYKASQATLEYAAYAIQVRFGTHNPMSAAFLVHRNSHTKR